LSDRLINAYESLHVVATDFSFLDIQFLLSQPVEILQKRAADLAFQYETDLNAVERTSEVESTSEVDLIAKRNLN